MDAYQALDRAVASTADVVKGIGPEDLARPTPCTAWDVRALLNHVIGTLWLAQGLFADEPPPQHATGPGALPAEDLVGNDPSAAYAEASAAALASASRPGTLEAPHQTPFGEMPGPLLAGFTTLDLFVHGWDLAKATGQHPTFDADLANHVLMFASEAITDATREPNIGPAVAAPEDAPVVDRLVAYLGRHP